MTEDNALVVLSGGQDSTTCLYWAKQNFNVIHAITFDYGQRHSREIDAALKIGLMAEVASHEVIATRNILHSISPLTSDTELEQYESFDEMDKIIGDRVEVTFVPIRNMFFLTIAANRAVELGTRHIVTGVCQSDNANYPDCRQIFIDSVGMAITRALGWEASTSKSIQISAPLMNMSKARSINLAQSLPGCMAALAWSHTAYDGTYPPTGADHATVLRAQGFLEAGVADPLILRAWKEGLMELPTTVNYDIHR